MDPKNEQRRPLPDDFYCQEKKVECSSTTARPNIDALFTEASDQSLWANTFSLLEEKKKLVVITEWRLARLPDVALEAYRLLINSVLLNGFSVYLLQEDKIGPLYSSHLQRQQFEKIRDLPRDKIYKIVTATIPHSSADEILLFDFDAQKMLAEHFGFPVVESFPQEEIITPMDVMNPSVIFSKEFIESLPAHIQKPLVDLLESGHGDLRDSGMLPLNRVHVYNPEYVYKPGYGCSCRITVNAYGALAEDESDSIDKVVQALLSTERFKDKYKTEVIPKAIEPQYSILPQKGRIYDYNIEGKTIDSFSWMEHIRSPTQLTFSDCIFTPRSVASCTHISNPYITRLTIQSLLSRDAGFFKSILTATPQLQFLNISMDRISTTILQECLDYLPAGCQLNLAASPQSYIKKAPIVVRIAYDIDSFKVIDFIRFDLNVAPMNHHQGYSKLDHGIQRIYATYTPGSWSGIVSLNNAVAAYYICLKDQSIQDIPNPEELHFPQLEVLEFEHVTITKELLLHIILYAPKLNTLSLKYSDCFRGEDKLGIEVVIALYNSLNFKTLHCCIHSFTPEAQLLLKSQEKFYWTDIVEVIQDIPVLPTIISDKPKSDRASRFIQDISVLPPMISEKPQAGIVYADCSDDIEQCVTDGKIALKKLPVCDKKPYFRSYPEAGAKSKLRQGLFYLDQEYYFFKNVKNIQTYQKIEIELKQYLNYQQGHYLKGEYVYEQYNPELTLRCMDGVRVPLYTTSPQDELVALAVRSLHGSAVSVTVERGDIDGLYYLTTAESSDIVCEFVMATPLEELQPVPQTLRELAKIIQVFGIGREDLPKGLSNKERLNALWERKEGACRHRTEVFLDKAAGFSNEVVVYMAVGSNHAWPEFCGFGMRTTQSFDCLGGYPTVDRYDENGSFKKERVSLVRRPLSFYEKEMKKERTIMQTAPEKKRKSTQMKTVSISDFYNGIQPGRNYLAVINHSDDAHVFMDSLLTAAPHRIHTVHHGKRLHTVGKGIVQTEQRWAQASKVPGALRHFLDNLQEGEVPVIILDLPPGDLVKYNSLFNRNCRNRTINSRRIPDNAIIIILATPYSAILEDNSILSRQHEVIRISAQQPKIESVAVSPEQAITTHSLYGSDDWQALLLGYCGYDKEGEPNIFKGHLLEAIQNGYPIKITHPPKSNADFDAFIRDVNAKKGFWFLNEWYNCPQGVEVGKSHAYDFSSVDQVGMSVMNIPPQLQEKHYYLINSHTFERCLRNTVIIGELPCQDLGWIEMAAGETLQLYVTDNLSEGQWYCLLETCVKHRVQLQVELAPGVSLPQELREHYPGQFPSQISNTEVCMELRQTLFGAAAGGTMVYSENHLDSYCQCQKLLNENGYKPFSDNSKPEKPYLLIDASELSDESALYRNKISNDNGVITASCDISNIVEILERENGIVVLTGDLSPALLGHLSTLFLEEPYLWINGEKHKVNGRLMIIPEKGQPLNKWIAPDLKFIHQVLPKPAVVPQPTPVLPTKVSHAQWWSKEEFQAVLEARKEFVLTALETKPFVFLQGPAGSGKSSLALQLQAEPDIAVYYEEDIAAWAKDTSHGSAKILFIDEANLRTQQQWTLFQGLFNDPPGIYYNQKFYPLTKDHKVIFAGNPLNHGGKRIEPTLFKRYPECTIDCPLLPAAYIEHAVLHDIFKYVPELSENIDLLAIECRAFLQDYDAATDDIRSLQSRAMLHCYEQIPDLNKAEKEKEQLASNYVLLKSRETCQQAIIDSLKIQQFKHWARLQPEHTGLLNAACYGGHSGVLIEGAPDTGKTTLIEATLFEQGYSKVTLGSSPKKNNTKVHYVMDPQYTDQILDRAFQEGAVLVWDELNSYLTPALTAKLNSYLSGYSQDKKEPNQAGFTLLSSINPAYMQGRVATDTALSSRLKQQHLKKYQDCEITEILEKTASDLSKDEKQNIECMFFEKWKKSVDDGSAKPGTRDLQELIEERREKKRRLQSTTELSTSSSGFWIGSPSSVDSDVLAAFGLAHHRL